MDKIGQMDSGTHELIPHPSYLKCELRQRVNLNLQEIKNSGVFVCQGKGLTALMSILKGIQKFAIGGEPQNGGRTQDE